MSTETHQWVRTHAFGGRMIGTFIHTDSSAPREMAVILTLRGPEIAPRNTLIPLAHDEVIGSLARRIEDLLDAAERVGYTLTDMRDALERALQQKVETHHEKGPPDV